MVLLLHSVNHWRCWISYVDQVNWGSGHNSTNKLTLYGRMLPHHRRSSTTIIELVMVLIFSLVILLIRLEFILGLMSGDFITGHGLDRDLLITLSLPSPFCCRRIFLTLVGAGGDGGGDVPNSTGGPVVW